MTLHPLPTCRPLDVPTDPRGLGGLLARAEGREVAFPLQSVRVRAHLTGTTCRTVVDQRFHNPLTQPMEAVHLFPLPEDGALVEVELRCGELVVRAECRERGQAEAAFAAARQAGHRAALVTRERDDIHTLRVTNLPPGEAVEVRVVVVEQLAAADGRVRWRFPTTIAPRYVPGTPIGHSGPGVVPDTDAAPDASRLQPPLRLAGGTPLDLEVEIDGRPTRVASSLHAVKLDLAGGLRVAPAASATCDRDFVLEVSFAPEASVGALAWTDGTTTVVTVDPPARPVGPALPRDAVFVIDISGSMEGTKMGAARRALTTALHGLAPGDRFQIIAFDDRVERFARDFVAYDDRSLAKADTWVAGLDARGGTEMLPAITAALDGDTPAGRLRTVLFVTDGQAADEERLVAAVANRARGARFFSLGIDTAVNGALLQRLARVGGGACELCTPGDDIEGVVARIEARFGSPVADEVRVEGGELARPEPMVLFTGRPATALLRGAPERVVVSLRTPGGPLRLEVAPARVPGPLLPLWARARVAWLEDRLAVRPFEEEAILPEIRRIALEAGIASRATAFVAVERTRRVEGAVREVVQPHELPAEWSEAFREGAVHARVAQVGGAWAHPPGAVACAPPPPARSAAPSGLFDRARRALSKASKKAEMDIDAMRPAFDAFDAFGAADEESAPAPEAAPSGPPAPPRRPAPATPPSAAAPARLQAPVVAAPTDPGATLAATQSADGSFGGDEGRTAAALVLLVRLGHTRLWGARRRVVAKAADWLRARGGALAALALALLDAAEAAEEGAPLPGDDRALYACGPEGALLRAFHER